MEGSIAAQVANFYERHPYPAPIDDLESYGRSWDALRRRAESHLFWPAEPYRVDRSILVAGCGTTQAAHYAVRWPRSQVIGIDVSAKSIAFTQELKQKYALDNLEVRQLSVERVAALGESFDHIVCTGVLHHLSDPDAALRALRGALAPNGALHMGALESISSRITAGVSASATPTPKSAISPQASKRFRLTIPSRHCCAAQPTSRAAPALQMRSSIRKTALTRSRS